jgi:hypothetical protein
MKKTRKAEENAKRIRSFLTSPVRQSAVFIIVVGIFVYLIYVLEFHPIFPFPFQNRLLVAILNGAIFYGFEILGVWMAMKAWESKAKKGR